MMFCATISKEKAHSSLIVESSICPMLETFLFIS